MTSNVRPCTCGYPPLDSINCDCARAIAKPAPKTTEISVEMGSTIDKFDEGHPAMWICFGDLEIVLRLDDAREIYLKMGEALIKGVKDGR